MQFFLLLTGAGATVFVSDGDHRGGTLEELVHVALLQSRWVATPRDLLSVLSEDRREHHPWLDRSDVTVMVICRWKAPLGAVLVTRHFV